MYKKELQPIRFNQVGSFYNFPNWRYLVYLDPGRAGLAYCKRKPNDGSSCLTRYIRDHTEMQKDTHVAFSFTPFFTRFANRLNLEQKDMFYKVFNKKLKARGDKKLFVPCYKSDDITLWNGKYVNLVVDKPLKKFLEHVTKVKYHPEYEFAVKYRNSEEHQRNFCVIGYCIYAGLSDTTIAHRYKLYPSQVRALRELFFDFSNAPTEVVARSAYFTQLADNKIISDVDRRYFKIIGSLGELGLKADADPASLTVEEKERLHSYLADSMLDNVTSLYFSIEDKKDALAYNAVINNLATFCIKKEEVNYFRAKIKNLDASTTRILNTKVDYEAGMQEEDRLAIEMISQLALKENTLPEYKVITALN